MRVFENVITVYCERLGKMKGERKQQTNCAKTWKIGELTKKSVSVEIMMISQIMGAAKLYT